MTNEKQISRRQFIATSAAAIAMPAIVPSSALGLNGKLPPSERINIGIIGVGYQARGHLEFLLRHPESQVLAVAEVDRTRREDAKRRADTYYEDQIKAGTYKA